MIVTTKDHKHKTYKISLKAWNGTDWWGNWEELLTDIKTTTDINQLKIDVIDFNAGQDLDWMQHTEHVQELLLTVEEVRE